MGFFSKLWGGVKKIAGGVAKKLNFKSITKLGGKIISGVTGGLIGTVAKGASSLLAKLGKKHEDSAVKDITAAQQMYNQQFPSVAGAVNQNVLAASFSSLLKNPLVLIGVALVGFTLLRGKR